MQDIVYRKVGCDVMSEPPSTKAVPIPEGKKADGEQKTHQPVHHTPTRVIPTWFRIMNGSVRWANRAIGRFLMGSRSDGRPALIIRTECRVPQIPQKAEVTAPRRARSIGQTGEQTSTPRAPLHKRAVRKAANTAKATRRNLKTPVGKVAAVNAALLLILFGYVLTVQHSSASMQSERNTGEALREPLQRYLPIVSKSDKQNTPFIETDLAAESIKLPLYAWVTPWNTTSIRQNLSSYQSLSAFWVTVGEDGSSLTPKGSWDTWDSLQKEMPASVQTYVTISGNPNDTYKILVEPETQQKFIENVVETLETHNLGGVDIDFEALGSENDDLYTGFIRSLSAACQGKNKKVAVTLEARIANQVPMDWHSLGQIADEVRIMAYDYHSRTTATPGPISPLGWVKEVLDYAIQTIPPEKIVLGLGNYGYDWTAPATEGDSWTGTGLSFEQGSALAEKESAPIVQTGGIDSRGYDIGSAPTFTYLDEMQTRHEVWMEDGASLGAKVSLASQYPIKGVIFWSVGLGDRSFWTAQTP